MVRTLIRLALALAANAIGLVVAALLLDKMNLQAGGFIIGVVIFTVLAALFQVLVRKVASSKAPTLEGASALITTFLALFVTNLISDGLSISGAVTWVLATVIVWAVTFVAGMILPKLFLSDEPADSR